MYFQSQLARYCIFGPSQGFSISVLARECIFVLARDCIFSPSLGLHFCPSQDCIFSPSQLGIAFLVLAKDCFFSPSQPGIAFLVLASQGWHFQSWLARDCIFCEIFFRFVGHVAMMRVRGFRFKVLKVYLPTSCKFCSEPEIMTTCTVCHRACSLFE